MPLNCINYSLLGIMVSGSIENIASFSLYFMSLCYKFRYLTTKLTSDILEIPADMEAAVTELEAQISECVPLFTGNSDPVGDLQMLLQGLQGELAECLRNRFVDMLHCISVLRLALVQLSNSFAIIDIDLISSVALFRRI